METLQLSGSEPRCWWCGKKIHAEPRRIRFVLWKKEYETVVCSPEHETAVTGAYRYVQKVFPLFWIGLLGGFGLLIVGKTSWPAYLGLLLLGLTIFICPFATPQTIELLGLEKSFRIGRIGGVILGLGGLILLATSFLRPIF